MRSDDVSATLSAEPLALRGWTGDYLQVRLVGEDDYRVWHADGRYLGRLIPDATAADPLEGIVFGPDGGYVADARRGKLAIDPRRRRATRTTGDAAAFASPGDLEPTERRWPRREQPLQATPRPTA